jgi:acyl-CoA reductase-like NAD-dependent aldehyde dehydrogenase
MPSAPEFPILMAGEWVPGEGARVAVVDKFTGDAFGTVTCASREQVRQVVERARDAAKAGPPVAFERGAILDRAAALVEGRRVAFVDAMRHEAGFTTADGENEATRCVQTLRLCAEEARRLAGEMVPMEGAPGQGGRIGFTLRVPLGVVCAITPYNAPLNGIAHKVAPAFAAGNAVVAKPSPFTPGTANLLAGALLEAGLPGAFLSVVHGGVDVGRWLVEEPAIAFYAFTGSTAAGREIQKGVGLRRSQMELGSIAHTLLDAGCNLERALPRVVSAAYRKAGQVCTSVQILLVHRSLHEEVRSRLAALVGALPYGDPARPDCVVGPLIGEDAAKRVAEWVEEALSQGAERLAGGPRQGRVLPPTLLDRTSPAMKVRSREVFGPVLSLVPFDTFDEAIAMANGTPFGLSIGVFTDSLAHAMQAARMLRSGAVHINESSSSRADLMPFGGSKDSGFGREGPRWAVREMSEERLVTLVP